MDTHKEQSKIGKRIKEIRLKQGLSQDSVSKKANLSFQTISKIESGATPNPTIDTVRKIANVLDISLDELMK